MYGVTLAVNVQFISAVLICVVYYVYSALPMSVIQCAPAENLGVAILLPGSCMGLKYLRTTSLPILVSCIHLHMQDGRRKKSKPHSFPGSWAGGSGIRIPTP